MYKYIRAIFVGTRIAHHVEIENHVFPRCGFKENRIELVSLLSGSRPVLAITRTLDPSAVTIFDLRSSVTNRGATFDTSPLHTSLRVAPLLERDTRSVADIIYDR